MIPASRELPGGQPAALLISQFPRSARQLGGDHFRVGVLIGDLFGQHMPDGDQQFTRNGDHGRVGQHPAGEALELSLPMRMVAPRTPGGFDQRPSFGFAQDSSRRPVLVMPPVVGVPALVVTGYATGDYDYTRGAWRAGLRLFFQRRLW